VIIIIFQVSKEGDTFDVPIEIAKLSNLVVTTLGEDDNSSSDEPSASDIEIPLPNVRTQVLAKVIEYCTHYSTVESMTPITTPLKSNRIEEIVQEWYAEFVDVEQRMLFELVTAANFMDIKALLDLTCLAVSVLIKVSSLVYVFCVFDIFI
jgi:S-phase kinase-associated protein 1